MPHTAAQQVRTRLTAVIERLTLKARSDERLRNLGGPRLTSIFSQAGIREEYRNIVRNEFPGCVVVFQSGRIKVFPPDGYLDVRGSVGAPIGPSLMLALFLGMGGQE